MSPSSDAPRVVVLATRNAGKIAELAALLAPSGLTVLGLADFPEVGEIPETGLTFLDNARLKAEAVCRATGRVAVADDSGLCVDALSGAPGVFSARYAGEGAADADNNAKLLSALAGVPEARRAARFVCAMVARTPDGREARSEGTWEGRVAQAPDGEGGFGYDPVFFDPELSLTAARLTREAKNARGHRGQALLRLLPALTALFDPPSD